MARRRLSPVQIGLIALAVVVAIAFLGFTKDIPFTRPYEVNAVFQSANSIRPGSPVRIAGVDVGKVKEVKADEDNQNAAVVVLQIDDEGRPRARGRDGQDPAAHLPRGQLLRRPPAWIAASRPSSRTAARSRSRRPPRRCSSTRC